MKKVGILTFCKANNYGAMLQAAALQKYLIEKKYDVEFINLNFNRIITDKDISNKETSPKSFFDKILIKYSRLRFKVFRRKYMNISSKEFNGDEEIQTSEFLYDFYVVGSDQVWNTDITNNTKAFFLNFVNEHKISYAASYGKKELNENEKKWSKEELPKFDSISVREISAVEYLEENTEVKPKLVCDPVFLLNKEQWINLLNLKNKKSNKYILVYYMEPSKNMINTINYFKDKLNINVKCICGGTKKISNLQHLSKKGPIEFLNLINNAELIITNSFHAVAFSMIFEKNFVVVSHSKWNARLDSLLELANAKEKIISNSSDNSLEKYIVNGKIAYNSLGKCINESKDFLDKALSNN